MSITFTRPGQVNGAGEDALELFIKQYSDEVITAFEAESVTVGRHWVKSIENGKSYTFPLVGRSEAQYHTAGTQLTGGGINQNERTIVIDGELVAHDYLPKIDEAMANYDVRSVYSRAHGAAIATKLDINVLSEAIKGARQSSHLVTGLELGGVIANDKFKKDTAATPTDVSEADRAKYITEGIFQAAARLDNNKVPKIDRYCFLRPEEFYCLFNNTAILSREFGGIGSIADGTIIRIAGIDVISSPNVPKTDTSSTDSKHGVDASQTIGVIFQKTCVGTVQLLELSTLVDWIPDYRAYLLQSAIAAGHGWLRPEGCIELALENLTNE